MTALRKMGRQLFLTAPSVPEGNERLSLRVPFILLHGSFVGIKTLDQRVAGRFVKIFWNLHLAKKKWGSLAHDNFVSIEFRFP